MEAQLVVLGAVARVTEDGCEIDGNGGAVAKYDEGDGLARSLLKVGEEGRNGVEVEAVDGFNLIAGLHAGAGRRGRFSSPARLLTWTGVFWIFGMRPSLSGEKSSGPPLFSTKILVSMRWPSRM